MEAFLPLLEELERRSQALEPSATQRANMLAEVQNLIDRFLKEIPDRPGYSGASLNNDFALNGESRTLRELLKLYQDEVIEKGIRPASGSHVGYIPGGGIYSAALADYLAAVSNEYAGMYFASPGAVTIENEVLDWMKSLFGFPKSAVGNLASGGSIANLIALTAARDHHALKGERIPGSVIYLSAQVHHCIHKALRIIGLEEVIIREMELDENSKLLPEKISETIEKDLEAGLNPFMVIASAGTTDTGAVDPLQAIGHLCQEHNLWYHIDAAYGGFFIMVEETRSLFKGIELADSLVVDPHKGLFLPYGVGAVLVKNKAAVLQSHHYIANYMQDAIDERLPVNPADVSPELTKHFRGLRIWLPLQLHGLDPFQATLKEKLILTKYFRHHLKEMGFEVGPEPDLSVSYFWYPSTNLDPDEYNERLMELIKQDGDVFLSSSRIFGRFVIRMAILSFRTKRKTIDKALAMVRRCREKLDTSLPPSSS